MKIKKNLFSGCLMILFCIPLINVQALSKTPEQHPTLFSTNKEESGEEQKTGQESQLSQTQGKGLFAPPNWNDDNSDPIGGAPVSDGVLILSVIAFMYACYRYLKNRHSMKKIFTLFLILCTSLSLSAQDRGQLRRSSNQTNQLRSAARNATVAAGSIAVDRDATIHNYTPEQLVKGLFIKNYNSCASSDMIQNVTLLGGVGLTSNTTQSWNSGTNQWQTTDRPLQYFDRNSTAFPLSKGLLLTTAGGHASEGPLSHFKAPGFGSISPDPLSGGYIHSDPDLLKLANSVVSGSTIINCSILEFDFIALKSDVTFNYIFASEEYPYWVKISGGGNWSDNFGFFVSGPGINGGKGYDRNAQNIAIVPGTNDPVSVLTINKGQSTDGNVTFTGIPRNPDFYVPIMNGSPLMEYGGYTVPMQAKIAGLIIGQQYHIKLAIANVGDSNLGSAVYLEAGSFDIGLGTVNFGAGIEGMDNIFSGSTDNSFYVGLYNQTQPLHIDLTYTFNGQPLTNQVTLLNGDPLPAQVTLSAGTTTFAQHQYKVADGVSGDLVIHANVQECGSQWDKIIKVYTKFSDPVPVVTTPCSGTGSGTIKFTVTGGSPSMQMSKDAGTTWQPISQAFTGLADGTYNIVLRDSIGSYQQTVPVLVTNGALTAGTITGTNSVPINTSPGVLAGSVSTGGSNQFDYAWESSTDNTIWTPIASSNSKNYTPGNLAVNTYFRRKTSDRICGGSTYTASFKVTVSADLTNLYWDKTTTSTSWSDINNWLLPDNSHANVVPGSGTTVHIPGDAKSYPVLTQAENAVCDKLILHFGGEVAQQHYLTYNKVFVQYNFGYYDASHVFHDAADAYSSPAMDRDRWYALAAPVKRMYSGDFSFGGYPFSWQQGFKTTPGHSGTTDVTGTWYAPEKKMAFDLGGNQYNAVSLYMPAYNAAVHGENDHKGLDGIKGIVEVPYFENADASVLSAHRLHTYQGANTSRFNYYHKDWDNFDIITDWYEDVSRTNGYRFVIEDEGTHVSPDDYLMTVPANTEIMIGNPFIASLDFDQFYAANSSVIENSYRLYINTNWDTYTVGGGAATLNKFIPPLQAFFIKTTGSGTVQLKFPRNSSVVPTFADINSLRSATENSVSAFYLSASNAKGNSSSVTFSLQESQNNLYRLFCYDYPDAPQIYALDNGMKNDVQRVNANQEVSIPVGILCSGNDKLTITFSNKNGLTFKNAYLEDKSNGNYYDLLMFNTYSFTNIPTMTDNRFVLHLNQLNAPTAVEGISNQQIAITTDKNMVYVTSPNTDRIQSVQVVDMQGRTIVSRNNINSGSQSVELPHTGIYIVNVTTQKAHLSQKVVVR